MMETSWKPSDNFTISLGASLTHYSSGAVRLPNLGINIPAWRIGLRYTPVPFSKNDFIIHEHPATPKKIMFNAQLGLGFQESAPPNGPMYHVYQLEFAAGKMLSSWDLLTVGIQSNYKQAANVYIKQEESYPDNFFINSVSASAYLKNDFLFGNIGMVIYVGRCFYYPSPLQLINWQKLGAYYAFPIAGNASLKRLTVGVYMTAGDFTADFVSVETGFRF